MGISQLVVAILVLSLPIIISFSCSFYIYKLILQQRDLAGKAVFISIVAAALCHLTHRSIGFFRIPESLAIWYGLNQAFVDGLTTVSCILIIAWFIRTKLWPTLTINHPTLNLADQLVLNNYVAKIVDSNNFLLAIRSILPKSLEDNDNGMIQVPYLLHTIDQRRERCRTSSRNYLILTVLLCILFSVLVSYFGYTIVNELAAGYPKTVAELEVNTKSISNSLLLLKPDLFKNEAFKQYTEGIFTNLKSTSCAGIDLHQCEDTINAINVFERNGNLKELDNALSSIKLNLDGAGTTNSAFRQRLDELIVKIRSFQQDKLGALDRIAADEVRLKEIMSKVNDESNKASNRIPELIKRIAVSLVIVTFFIMILRYFGGIYQDHYKQMLQAEADDFLVRRFCISYKASNLAFGGLPVLS